MNSPYYEQRKKDKAKAIDYYKKYLLNARDSTKTENVKKWLDVCQRELIALDSGTANLNAEDEIDKEKAISDLQNILSEIREKYMIRLDAIYDLESEVDRLKKENRELVSQTAIAQPQKRSISLYTWVLLVLLTVTIIALAYALRNAPGIASRQAAKEPAADMEMIDPEKIAGSYIWVESVHNRGMMAIRKDEHGYFVETRAINTSAISSGRGKYENNVLEAMLSDESGEGALMRFEFFEDGRAFVASWEDELGHGSAVGLRNEFDEMIRPDATETDADA